MSEYEDLKLLVNNDEYTKEESELSVFRFIADLIQAADAEIAKTEAEKQLVVNNLGKAYTEITRLKEELVICKQARDALISHDLS